MEKRETERNEHIIEVDNSSWWWQMEEKKASISCERPAVMFLFIISSSPVITHIMISRKLTSSFQHWLTDLLNLCQNEGESCLETHGKLIVYVLFSSLFIHHHESIFFRFHLLIFPYLLSVIYLTTSSLLSVITTM